MIKKLRNQPCAPKVGASSQMGAKRKKKKCRGEISVSSYGREAHILTGEEPVWTP
jgi:hypothetical protein